MFCELHQGQVGGPWKVVYHCFFWKCHFGVMCVSFSFFMRACWDVMKVIVCLCICAVTAFMTWESVWRWRSGAWFSLACFMVVFKMAYVESQAVFESRVLAVGLSDEVKKAFLDGGVKSLATLAFISDYHPGSQSEKSLLEVFEKLLGRESSVAERAGLRRLFHESYALVTAELKSSVEKSEESVTRKLSQPERNDRYETQVKKLSGMKLRGQHEPADALVDFAVNIYDDNRLRWISWDKCISKEQELMGDKKEQAFTVSGNTLKLESRPADAIADTSSDILLNYALTRRSLAMDQANLVDLTVMQTWTDKIMKTRVDAPPAGFQKPSLKQLMSAVCRCEILWGASKILPMYVAPKQQHTTLPTL